MGLFSIFSGRSKHSGTKADNRSLEQQLIDAEVWLTTVLALPPSEFGIKIANGVIVQHSINAKDISIAKAQARVAALKTRIRLSQRLSQAEATTDVQKNAKGQSKETE